jgi:hypothetical protein
VHDGAGVAAERDLATRAVGSLAVLLLHLDVSATALHQILDGLASTSNHLCSSPQTSHQFPS